MRTSRSLLVLVLASLAFGCARDLGSTAQIELRPADFTTGLAPSSFASTTIDMWTSSEGETGALPPPASVFRHGETTPLVGGTLAPGWYDAVLDLSAAEAERFTVAGRWRGTAEHPTHFVNHFHVGSAPVLFAVASADPIGATPENWSILLGLSEPVMLADGVADVASLITIRIDGGDAGCAHVETTPDVELATVLQITYGCPSGLVAGAQVHVHVAPGIVSIDGHQPLRDMDGHTDCDLEWSIGDAPFANGPHELTDALVAATDP